MGFAIKRQIQKGSSTLDFLFASALIAQATIVFSQLSYANSADLQALAASQYMSQFSGAVQQYVADNASTILSGPLPKQITASTLTPNYLPTGTSGTSPLGQTVCAKVVSPAANQLAALVMTDGVTLSGNQQQKLALNVGAKAGIVATTGGPLAGIGGSWSMSNATLQSYGTCSAGAGTAMGTGQVAINLFFSSLSLTSDYLHRTAIPGNGAATTMNSPLGLATVTDGATCTQTGQIAATAMGVIEACQGSVWTAAGGGTWKAPAASYAALPASGNTSGDARVTTDTQRMYVWNGTSWSATGVDQNGNMTVPGDVTAKTLTLTGTATEGGSCTKNGQVSQDGSGSLLSCQSGFWKSSQKLGFYGYGNSNGCGATTINVPVPIGKSYHLVASGGCFSLGADCQLYIRGAFAQGTADPVAASVNVSSGWSDVSSGSVPITIQSSNGPTQCKSTWLRVDAIW